MAITVASQLCASGCSTGASLLKYNPPTITSTVAYPRPLPIGGSKDGAVISIYGTGFGPVQGVTASLGATSCLQVKWASETYPLYSDFSVLNVLWHCLLRIYALGATSCLQVNWASDSLVLCQPAPGAGANLKLKVEVGGQVGVAGDDLEYRAPVLGTLTPRLLPREGAMVTVVGSHFLSDVSAFAAVL